MHSTGGMVTTTMVLATGEVIVRTHNKKLLDDKDRDKTSGGPINLTRYWAKSFSRAAKQQILMKLFTL